MWYTSCHTIDEKAQPYVVYLVCFTFYSGKKTWVKVLLFIEIAVVSTCLTDV